MDLVTLGRSKPAAQGCVATIGNFDGVHLGHQAVLKQLRAAAQGCKAPSLIISFEPLPQEYFGRAQARLTRFRERFEALSALSVDQLLCLRFHHALALTSAQDFVRGLLVDRLAVRHLVIGDDFRFGRERRGDFNLLQTLGPEFGFDVARTESFLVDGMRVSSTRVREALKSGSLADAERLLGRRYAIAGRVRRGEQRGRTIGFPTANLSFGKRPPPLSGVFAVRVRLADGRMLAGVANAGLRPTVGGSEYRLETHVFDFDGNLYGQRIHVEFLHRLREERRFESFTALKMQIELDAAEARRYLAQFLG